MPLEFRTCTSVLWTTLLKSLPPDCSADCSAAVIADWIWLCKPDDVPEEAELAAVLDWPLDVIACNPLSTSEFSE